MLKHLAQHIGDAHFYAITVEYGCDEMRLVTGFGKFSVWSWRFMVCFKRKVYGCRWLQDLLALQNFGDNVFVRSIKDVINRLIFLEFRCRPMM